MSLEQKPKSSNLAVARLILSGIFVFAVCLSIVLWVAGYLAGNKPVQKILIETPVMATITPIADNVADWQTYKDKEHGFELKYPQSWEYIINDPTGEKYLSFRDKKYNGGWEWPGLDIIWSFKSNFIEAASKIFRLENSKDDLVKIHFANNNDQSISAICKLYGDPSVIDICNQIISTFKFTEKELIASEIVSKIVSEASGIKEFQKTKAEDLNNDGKPEIIISDGDYNKDIYNIYIVTVIDKEGNYKKIGQLKLPLYSGGWLIDEIVDINNDNVKEIILVPEMQGGTGGSRISIILSIDFKNSKIVQIKAKDAEGKIVDTFGFTGGGDIGRCNYTGWVFGEDFNNNSKKEIVSLNASTSQDISACNENPDSYISNSEDRGLCKNCELSVYEWNGLIFAYNKVLSEQAKSEVNLKEFQGSGCDSCEWEK